MVFTQTFKYLNYSLKIIVILKLFFLWWFQYMILLRIWFCCHFLTFNLGNLNLFFLCANFPWNSFFCRKFKLEIKINLSERNLFLLLWSSWLSYQRVETLIKIFLFCFLKPLKCYKFCLQIWLIKLQNYLGRSYFLLVLSNGEGERDLEVVVMARECWRRGTFSKSLDAFITKGLGRNGNLTQKWNRLWQRVNQTE